MDVRITGAEELAAVARRLKEAGNKDLRREMMRGLQRAARPARDAAKEAARVELPSAGGLNDRVAGSKFTIKTRTSGKAVGVSIVGKGDLDLPALDRGRLRHPLFGNRRHWYTQMVRPRWFTEAMEKQAPQVRRELVDAVAAIARRL